MNDSLWILFYFVVVVVCITNHHRLAPDKIFQFSTISTQPFYHFFIRHSYILLIVVFLAFSQYIQTNICKSIRMLKIVQMKHIKTGRITVNCMDLGRKQKKKKILKQLQWIWNEFWLHTLNQRWPNVRDSNRLLVLDQLNSSNSDCCYWVHSNCLAEMGSVSKCSNVPNHFPVVCVSSHLWAKRKLFDILWLLKTNSTI